VPDGSDEATRIDERPRVGYARMIRLASRQLPRLLAALGLLAMLALPASGQQPTFQSAVDLVQIDVSVLDGDRQPVRGLTADDFVVLDEGEPRPVVAFSAIEMPVEAPAAESNSTTWTRTVAPDVVTNDLSEGRLFVLVLDDGMTPADPRFTENGRAIGRHIIEGMAPADRAAVVLTWNNRRPQNFTADRERLLAAVDQFAPGPYMALPPVVQSNNEVQFDAVDARLYLSSIDTLRMVTNALRAIPNRQKIVVYVGPGVPADIDKASQLGTSADAELHRTAVAAMQDVFLRAAEANVVIYSFDPTGLGGMQDVIYSKLVTWRNSFAGATRSGRPGRFGRSDAASSPFAAIQDEARRKTTLSREYVQEVAAATGGVATYSTDNFDQAVDRLLTETAVYYLLGFEPAARPEDGSRPREIEVQVRRPGVSVRARDEYTPAGLAGAAPPASLAVTALEGLVPRTDLPLTVTAAPFASPAGNDADVAVVLGIQPPAGILPGDRLSVTVGAFTPIGREVGANRFTFEVAGDSPQVPALELLSRLALPPGSYELRVSAESALLATAGSVYVDVDVPDFDDLDLALSGIIIASDGTIPSVPADPMEDLLPAPPTARRVFGPSDRATAFLRLYRAGNAATAPAELDTSIEGQGEIVWSQQNAVAAAPPGTPHAVLHVDVPLPLAALDPGPYLLTVRAISDAPDGGTVERRVRFTIGEVN